MKKIIKTTNWILAGCLSLLGFVSCTKALVLYGVPDDILPEYGTPNADYTVKGAVVNKVTGKPIKGIRVGYSSENLVTEYGVIQQSYSQSPYVLTNEEGEFKLTNNIFPVNEIPVFVEDIDGEENGLFQSEQIQVDFTKAEHTKKGDRWYSGEYTVTMNVELTEMKEDE
jgi:putative lipoprotein (rSAM/lipoprotein system)